MKKVFYIRNQSVKDYVRSFVDNLPVSDAAPFKVVIGEEYRSLDQNAALWPLLEQFAVQRPWPVNGAMTYITAEDWKDILSAAYRKEQNRIAQGIDGGVVILGMRTSKMGKKEFSEFLDFVHAAAAELGVEFEDRAAA